MWFSLRLTTQHNFYLFSWNIYIISDFHAFVKHLICYFLSARAAMRMGTVGSVPLEQLLLYSNYAKSQAFDLGV
jgi:hypothetical protein